MDVASLLGEVAASRWGPCDAPFVTWDQWLTSIRSDVHRLNGRHDWRALLWAWFRPARRVLMVVRVGQWSLLGGRRRRPVRQLGSVLYRRWSPRFGLEVPFCTQIGPVLKVAPSRWGRDQSGHPHRRQLRPDGWRPHRRRGGDTSPIMIGDDVRISASAKVISSSLGDRVLVGVNAVVTHDVPPDTVVAGVPARVILSARTTAPRHAWRN